MEDMTGGGVAISTKWAIIAVDLSITAANSSTAINSATNAGLASSLSAMQINTAAGGGATTAPLGGGLSSPFTLLCAAALARTDDGLWKIFIDCLANDEREYGKQLRRRFSALDKGRRAWLVSVRSEGAVCLL